MIRKYFGAVRKSTNSKIRWRSHEPSRIEALSDAVFGFAVSLLAFSLEVPKTSGDLLHLMGAFLPFLICFAAIVLIWYDQYRFFRHFGLHDRVTIILNAALLFLVLFYVYPLKFMFSSWLLQSYNIYTIEARHALPLIYVYMGGYIAIYSLFVLMHCNAYARRNDLKLTDAEVFETKTLIYNNMILVGVGLLVIIAAIIFNKIDVNLTFVCFIMFAVISPAYAILGKKRAKLFHKKFGNIPISVPELGPDE